jgi:myxalamid-type polyketide synthase MxaE and MxaD
MVQQGARRLILVGRTVLPERALWSRLDLRGPDGERVRFVRELEASGASVHVGSMNLADDAAVRAFFDRFEHEGWPPVAGVVHCAAVTDDRLLARLDAESLARVMAPKVAGTWNLHARLSATPLDFFVCFSSIGALLGQPGQASYAAANAFLDAFAAWCQRTGHVALSINWGGWRGLGFAAAGGGRETSERLERSGLAMFDAPHGLEALGQLLGSARSSVVVVPADWDRYRTTRPEAASSLLTTLFQESARPETPGELQARRSMRAMLGLAEPAERRPLLERHLSEQLAAVLRLPVARLDPARPLGSMGLESLTALEFRNRLETSLGIKLSATLVWNHPTIKALATYIAARIDVSLEGGTPDPVPGSAPRASAVPAPNVEALSEDEAVRALLGGE